MAASHPKLRALEVFPVRDADRDLICLRDPAGFTDQIISVSRSAVAILQCLDGTNSVADIQDLVARATGQRIGPDAIRQFVAALDKALMLDSPHFQRVANNLLAEFRADPTRQAVHAGVSYPAEKTEILKSFDLHYRPPAGPRLQAKLAARPPAAIVAPHIDLRHGGTTYAWAFAQLRQQLAIDLFVILGVAHGPVENRFVGTLKNFRTPLGTAITDRDFMQSMANQLSFDLFADELAHRREHSVEFQVVYLQHALASRTDYRIAPFLVGSFHDLMQAGREPIRDRQVAGFVKALRTAISQSGKRVCVIAGVDLAHVGARFGDEFTVNEEVRAELEREDREMLATVTQRDPRELCGYIYAERDRRRVDGFPAIYTLLHALDLTRGELLHYDQNFEPDTNSIVTFAGMRFD